MPIIKKISSLPSLAIILVISLYSFLNISSAETTAPHLQISKVAAVDEYVIISEGGDTRGAASAKPTCHVDYKVTDLWATGYTIKVSLINKSAKALDGWQVKWTLPESQKVTGGWNGLFTQQGQSVEVQHKEWNKSVAIGGSFSFAFNGSYSGEYIDPTDIRLDGTLCTGQPSKDDFGDPAEDICELNYVIRDHWDTGITVDVELLYKGTERLTFWNVKWLLSANQRISYLWEGNYTQNDNQVSITNKEWNKIVYPNKKIKFGFNAIHSGKTPLPTQVTLNGRYCLAGEKEKLEAPSSLVAKLIDNKSAYLEWQDNSDNEAGFIIQRYEANKNWETLKTVLANTTHYNDDSLTIGVEYRYRVKAVSSKYVTSTDSNEVNIKRQDRFDIQTSMLADTCATCHATDGESKGLSMPLLAGLGRGYFIKTMLAYQDNSRASTMMSRIAKGYTKTQIERLADYFSKRTFPKSEQVTDATLVTLGKVIHTERCIVCHAENGKNTEISDVRLAGQWQYYLDHTLNDYVLGKTTNTPQGMAAQLNGIKSRYGDNALLALSHYYAANNGDGTGDDDDDGDDGQCVAKYTRTGEWNTGFTTAVVITNKTGKTLEGWTVSWTLPTGQQIKDYWNITWTEKDNVISAVPLSWNKVIAANKEIKFGFNIAHSGNNAIPSDIKLNGQLCKGQTGGGDDDDDDDDDDDESDPKVIPTPPSNLDLLLIDNSVVNLVWKDTSNNETGFRLYRREQNGEWNVLRKLETNTSKYIDTTLEMGKSYEYKLLAFNTVGDSKAIVSEITLLTILEYGKAQYRTQGCLSCHGEDGKGGFTNQPLTRFSATQFAELTKINSDSMPPSNPKACIGNCASAIAQYIIETFKTGSGDDEQSCDTNSAPPSERSLRLLSRYEYQNTVNDLLGLSVDIIHQLPEENRVQGFDNNINDNQLNGIRLEAFLLKAETLASQAIQTNWGGLVSCDANANGCATTFITDFGKRAYRRPLSNVEINAYLNYFTDNEFSEGVELSLMGFLSSPHFLYRSELGELQSDGYYKLTQYEIASSLSYLFWGSMPDAALFSAAEQNKLTTELQRITQASRLLNAQRSRTQVGNFVGQWLLKSSPFSLPDKDLQVYPKYTKTVRAALSQELINFFNYVAFDSSQQFKELFSSNYIIANKTLANYYQQSGPQSDTFELTPVTDKTRFGLLTLGAVLSRYANSNESHPFKRGSFFFERVLCHDLPAAANMGVINPPKPDPDATTRERFAFHSDSNTSCFQCHQYLDGPGFSFENYDGVGGHRLLENDKSIDASGILRGLETYQPDEERSISNLYELSHITASSKNAAECLATQYYRFTTGREESTADSCVLKDYIQQYENNGYNLQTLLLGIVNTHGFILRRAKGE
jgi:cytochrome c553